MGNISKLQPEIRVSIVNPGSNSSSVFGRGIAQLCKGVRDSGSLNAAAKGMGMAYSKAWRIIKETEAALGVDLLIRNGAHGSVLTEEGNFLVDAYAKLEEHLSQTSQKEYEKLLK